MCEDLFSQKHELEPWIQTATSGESLQEKSLLRTVLLDPSFGGILQIMKVVRS